MSLINAEAFLDGMRDLYAKAGWDPKEVHFSLNDLIANIEGEQKVETINPYDETFGFAAYVINKDEGGTRVGETWGNLNDEDLLAVFTGFISDINADERRKTIWQKAIRFEIFYSQQIKREMADA